MTTKALGPPLSRRELLLGMAVMGGVRGSALASTAGAPAKFDALVIGGGTAGLSAALNAAKAGASVAIIEKGSRLGGTLWFSGGQLSGAGTARAKQIGIKDSPAMHLEDVMRLGEYKADPALVALAVNNAADTINWFDARGVEWRANSPVDATGHEPYSARRLFAPARAGVALLEKLMSALPAFSGSIAVYLETEATELIVDSSSVVGGVTATDSTGIRRDFIGRRVLLTSGGANGNPAIFAEFNSAPQYRPPWWPLNTGIGHRMAIEAGGVVRGQDAYLPDIGSVPATRAWPASSIASAIHHPQRRPPWEVYVNSSGIRFMREDHTSIDYREKAVAAQLGHAYWSIFDAQTLASAPSFLLFPDGKPVGPEAVDEMVGTFYTVVRADDLDALARQCNLPVGVLVETVNRYNAAVASGRDWLGREYMPRPIESAPYYGVFHRGASLISFGGIAVDKNLQVVRRVGSSIAGLFAAGEILGAGALMGRGYSGGMMVTPALTLGRLLGRASKA